MRTTVTASKECTTHYLFLKISARFSLRSDLQTDAFAIVWSAQLKPNMLQALETACERTDLIEWLFKRLKQKSFDEVNHMSVYHAAVGARDVSHCMFY
jgi:hypothetical protein